MVGSPHETPVVGRKRWQRLSPFADGRMFVLGHVILRCAQEFEYHSPTIWLPSSVALVLGFLLELRALMSDNAYLSAALGIFGITVLWDALEFWRQHRRVRKGHAPANPNNPRHVRLLQNSVMATTIDGWIETQ